LAAKNPTSWSKGPENSNQLMLAAAESPDSAAESRQRGNRHLQFTHVTALLLQQWPAAPASGSCAELSQHSPSGDEGKQTRITPSRVIGHTPRNLDPIRYSKTLWTDYSGSQGCMRWASSQCRPDRRHNNLFTSLSTNASSDHHPSTPYAPRSADPGPRGPEDTYLTYLGRSVSGD